MFVCASCGAVFEDAYTDVNGGGDFGENYHVCPNCGECVDEEAEYCEICGEYKHPNDMVSSHCCADCVKNELTVENALKFIHDDNKETEFFVEWMFGSKCELASESLLFLCKGSWQALGDYGINELYKFVMEYKTEFAQWIEVQ